MKQTKKKEERINVHNDDEVRAAGIWRPYNVTPRDPSVWTKTKKERQQLKKMKHIKFVNGHFFCNPPKHSVLTAKLVIYLKKNNKFPQTVYSYMCPDTSVSNYLRNFITTSKKGKAINWISKYSYNGRYYAADETINVR